MRAAPIATLFARRAPARRKPRPYDQDLPIVNHYRPGDLDPAISFKRASSPGYEGERGDAVDWIDIVSSKARSDRYEETVAQRLLRPSRTFEADYDEDPADTVRSRPAVNEWASPLSSRTYPRVEIGDRYREALPLAERALALRAERVASDEIVLTLSVEFERGWDVVVDDLKWMGVWGEIAVRRSRPPRRKRTNQPRPPRERNRYLLRDDPRPVAEDAPHGTVNGYANYGCRCPDCTGAARAYRRDREARIRATRRADRATGRS